MARNSGDGLKNLLEFLWGRGEVVQGEGKCRQVLLKLKGIDVVEDFLPL